MVITNLMYDIVIFFMLLTFILFWFQFWCFSLLRLFRMWWRGFGKPFYILPYIKTMFWRSRLVLFLLRNTQFVYLHLIHISFMTGWKIININDMKMRHSFTFIYLFNLSAYHHVHNVWEWQNNNKTCVLFLKYKSV